MSIERLILRSGSFCITIDTRDFMSVSEGFQQVNHAHVFGDISAYERGVFIGYLINYYNSLTRQFKAS